MFFHQDAHSVSMCFCDVNSCGCTQCLHLLIYWGLQNGDVSHLSILIYVLAELILQRDISPTVYLPLIEFGEERHNIRFSFEPFVSIIHLKTILVRITFKVTLAKPISKFSDLM